MRHGLAVVCLMASACASENELRYTSTLQAQTNGVALSEDGLDSFAAMAGVTCTIDTNWGCPTEDVDLPTTEEKLVDHWAGETIGTSSQGVHIIEDGVWSGEADFAIADVRTASLTDSGHIIVSGTEDACFVQRDDGDVVEINGAICSEDATFSVDREAGTLFAATTLGVMSLSADREAQAGPGDLASYDPSLHVLYTADQGDTLLRALNMQGQEVWSVTTSGAIRSLTARGDRGEVMVLVDRNSGLALIERRDGENGKLLGKSVIPTADGIIESSDNGRTIAVIRGEEVNFFALDDDTEPVIDETPPECIVPTAPGQNIALGD